MKTLAFGSKTLVGLFRLTLLHTRSWGWESKDGVTERSLKGSRDLLLEFWDLLHISGTVEAMNFKFGTQMITRGTNEKMVEVRNVK